MCVAESGNEGVRRDVSVPSQIMRMTSGHFNLIDLDASAPIGDDLGAKASSAFAPPEMLVQLDDRIVARSSLGGTLLRAAPSYDIFSFGCIFKKT